MSGLGEFTGAMGDKEVKTARQRGGRSGTGEGTDKVRAEEKFRGKVTTGKERGPSYSGWDWGLTGIPWRGNQGKRLLHQGIQRVVRDLLQT